MRTDRRHTIGIVADDLTSAADGAAPFVARGRVARVGRNSAPTGPGTVIAVDCASRSASAAGAAERVAAATTALGESDVLYKTVDSTLRGHVTAEIRACFAASGRRRLVFAPAFPAAGRTTVGGIQLVDGVPVAESAYGRDPVHPARHSALAELLPAGIDDVVLLDADTQSELEAKVAALPDPESILWVGSPGMASALAARFAPEATAAATPRATDGDVLVVVGTANPASHRQASRLDRMRGVTLIRSPLEREDDSAAVLQRIANGAAQAVVNGTIGVVIATGGDTMEAILDRLDIREFEIVQELEPGFPVGRATFGKGRHLVLAMKAGGFGDDDALHRAVVQLRRGTPLSWAST